jgi:hypothetical protein
LRISPDQARILNNLAWLLATDGDPELRDGTEAVRLAEQARALEGRDSPSLLDTLAAAYAAADRFPDAVETGRLAAQAARNGGDARLADEIEIRVDCYRKGQLFLQSARP